MSELKLGDMVRVKRDCSYDEAAWARRGRTGTLVGDPREVETDWHRGSWETVCRVRFGPGEVAEIQVRDLELADAVSQLAQLGRFLPTEEDIGRGVVYTPPHGGPPEDGAITGMNDKYVFVRYRDQHPGAPGKATRYEDLRWLSEVLR